MVWEGKKSVTSLVFAIIMLVLGMIPLLNQVKIITLNLGFMLTPLGSILSYILALGALFLIVDSFMEDLYEKRARITLLIGSIFLLIGLLPIIGITIPFINSILTPVVYYFLFTIEGVLLLIDTFLM